MAGIFERLHRSLAKEGLTADVLIWDDFHDRYLVSNLIGILMPNGFDISNKQNEMTTWARISRTDQEKIQREFDVTNNAYHTVHASFTIGQAG